MRRGIIFWFLILLFSVNTLMLLLAQVGLFDYDLAVSMGQHEPRSWIGETGVAIALGFNVGDVLQEIFCVLAIIGLFRRKLYGWMAALCEMTISMYRSIVFSGYYFFAGKTEAFQIPSSALSTNYLFFLLYTLVGVTCIIYLVTNRQKFTEESGHSK